MMKEAVAAGVATLIVGGALAWWTTNTNRRTLSEMAEKLDDHNGDHRPSSTWIVLTRSDKEGGLCKAELTAPPEGMKQGKNRVMSWKLLDRGCRLPDGEVFLDFEGQGNPVYDGKPHPFVSDADLRHQDWIVAKTVRDGIPNKTKYKYKIRFQPRDGAPQMLIDPELELAEPVQLMERN